MKITRSHIRTVARMWGRGFMRGASVFYVVYFPFILWMDLLRASEDYPLLSFTVGPLLFILWAVLAPLYLLEVDKLVEDGSTDAARKVFHQHAGGTWDQAYFALANWPTTLLVKKLELIQHKLNGAC